MSFLLLKFVIQWQQKMIQAYQKDGHKVCMIGDGISRICICSPEFAVIIICERQEG